MALVHNNLLSVFAGVSKQSKELRLPNNCEEMVNIYPTVHHGLRRRNPTIQVSSAILTEENQFMHTYDRGLSGETSEQYVITIDKVNGLRVLDVGAGIYRTVTYSGAAAGYLQSSNPEIGFSAITIKDTTFIANRDIVPSIAGLGAGATINNKSINLDMTSYGYKIRLARTTTGQQWKVVYFPYGYSYTTVSNLPPARVRVFQDTGVNAAYAVSALGATTTVTVDGVDVKYTTTIKTNPYDYLPETMDEYRINLYKTLYEKLDAYLYLVTVGINGNVIIHRQDGAVPVVSTAITFPTAEPINPPLLNEANSLTNFVYVSTTNQHTSPVVDITSGAVSGNVQLTSTYDAEAFVWIKSVSPDTTFPYTFYLSIKELNGTVIGSTSTAATTSNGVASALATWANGLTGFTATSDGSVCKIVRTNGTTFEIVLSDTFGSQASSGWVGAVTSMDDLPKHFNYKDTIVKVDGLNTLDTSAYWVRYDGKTWIEHRDPRMPNHLIDYTMPHKLVRNADFTFTLSVIDYEDILVGDVNTNPIPEFVGSPIKDLFFVNSRLGILTKNGISLSQQGEFGNFFRTTILQLLDDSAITTYIDSNKSVGLEYATELSTDIILFGDKQQFRLDASKGITPSSISVTNLAGYEINKNVRPISHGDSVYFISQRGDYSSLMKMDAATLATVAKAEDVSSHIPNYLDGDIIQIVGSIRNQAIFLKSRSKTDTVYLYKSHMENNEDKQKSWSKWTFSSDISSIFTFDRYLYLFGSRYDETVPTEEFTFVEYLDFSKTILFETYISYGTIIANPSFEKIVIDPYEITGNFKDNDTVRYNSEVELSEWFLSGRDGVKEMRGTLLVKTMMVSSTQGSDFSLEVTDKERSTTRTIPALYTVNRKPFISGNSKNMKIKIKSNNGFGFQINSISLEGQYNNRSTRTT